MKDERGGGCKRRISRWGAGTTSDSEWNTKPPRLSASAGETPTENCEQPRNLTSHAHDEALAARIYNHIVQEYAALLDQMAGRIEALSWE